MPEELHVRARVFIGFCLTSLGLSVSEAGIGSCARDQSGRRKITCTQLTRQLAAIICFVMGFGIRRRLCLPGQRSKCRCFSQNNTTTDLPSRVDHARRFLAKRGWPAESISLNCRSSQRSDHNPGSRCTPAPRRQSGSLSALPQSSLPTSASLPVAYPPSPSIPPIPRATASTSARPAAVCGSRKMPAQPVRSSSRRSPMLPRHSMRCATHPSASAQFRFSPAVLASFWPEPATPTMRWTPTTAPGCCDLRMAAIPGP